MAGQKFQRYLVEEVRRDRYVGRITQATLDELPEGDTLIRVRYSSLNYKDALSASGNKGVTKAYPHTPGIDAAGEVVESASASLRRGDPVILTGYDLGMNTSGGFSQYIRVPEKWLIKCPESLTLHDAMVFGTAGLTAALSVDEIVSHKVTPDMGPVLVTGATGGVASIAISILGKLGFEVHTVTGKPNAKPLLEQLGARSVIERVDYMNAAGKMPLLAQQWSAVIDTVGGEPLGIALKSTKYGGYVTTCGMVASTNLELTVFPFILRSVSLIGVDSVWCNHERRKQLWGKLSSDWKAAELTSIVSEIGLEDLNDYIPRILRGEMLGRAVVQL